MDYSKIIDLSPGRDRIEILHDLLLSRGFLMEYDEEGRLCLSDNCALSDGSCPRYTCDIWYSDIKFLRSLLKRSGLGTMGRDRIIHYSGKDFDDEVLSCFLDFEPDGRITYVHASWQEPDWFYDNPSGNLRGPKIQLEVLETYVGLLVKALSAIGAHSFTSCDGHGWDDVHVGFVSFTHCCWAYANVEYAVKKLGVNYFCDFQGRKFHIRHNSNSEAYYSDIIRIARFIYENRLKILEAKARVIKEADPKMYLDEDIKFDYTMDIMESAIRSLLGWG